MREAETLPPLQPQPGSAIVTGLDFADNDTTVVAMYHELARRHQELVRWVKEKVLAK